ncbi:MAG: hypothetical protein V4667_06550 [Bacteroidota bacterium]
MDYNSAHNLIEEIENRNDLGIVKYSKYKAWPLIKYHLYFALLKYNENKEDSPIANSSTTNKQSFVKSVIKFPLNIFRYFVYSLKYKNELSVLLNKVKKNTVLFIDVDDVLYEDKIDNKLYSRYISPYIELVKKNYETTLLNVSSDEKSSEKSDSPYYFNIQSFIDFSVIKNQLRKRNDVQLENFDLISNSIDDKRYKELVSKSFLESQLKKIEIYEEIWHLILSNCKPKAVFMSCHYGNLSNYGLLVAAKKLNIKTIEIQHGLSLGVMYTGWNKMPKNATYEFLPDYYWCWSLFDKISIENSRGSSKMFQPLLGGNAWFTKNILLNINNDSNLELNKLIDNNKPKKIILVTLQHSIPTSEILIDAIRKSNSDYLWLIRFHPRDYFDPEYRKNYIEALKEFKNIEYVNATKANLYPLLKQINFHITHHSAVSVEALAFNIPTILLGNKFSEIFEKYIKAKLFQIANTSLDILNIVNSDLPCDFEKFNMFKFYSSTELPIDIKNILQ